MVDSCIVFPQKLTLICLTVSKETMESSFVNFPDLAILGFITSTSNIFRVRSCYHGKADIYNDSFPSKHRPPCNLRNS